jgi:hypothetical protein
LLAAGSAVPFALSAEDCVAGVAAGSTGGLQIEHGPYRAAASTNFIGIWLLLKLRQPARWYFEPVLVTYTVSVGCGGVRVWLYANAATNNTTRVKNAGRSRRGILFAKCRFQFRGTRRA